MMYMYWLFYFVGSLVWALFASCLPLLLAMLPPVVVWILLQYSISYKILKPLKINGYYYLVVNILSLIYTLGIKYGSYRYFLEMKGEDLVSSKFQHFTFGLETLLAFIGFVIIINTWNKFYRRVKLCKD